MRHNPIVFLVCALLFAGGCSDGQWEPLTEDEFARHSEPLIAALSEYVAAQEAFFSENDRYARHNEIAYPPKVRTANRTAAEYVADGFHAIAYDDSVPQMVCGVFSGTAEPPLDILMEDGEPACQHEAAILVCDEGHAYPATTGYNFCPMHGHELVEVVLIN